MKKEYLVHHEIWKQIENDIGYNKAGVYKLHCFADDNKSYRATSRLLGQDTDGVLYIGSSKNCLVTRILALRKSLCAAADKYAGFTDINAHQCGKKYSQAVQTKFPFKSLCVTIYSVPLFEKEGLGEILLENPPLPPRFARPLFQRGK
ncbi:MAG: hypothetical protein Q8N96_13060 [Methylovulum sp.]|nr:hypothetical protein [Methylovulum sp.]